MFYIEQTKETKCYLGDGTVINDWDNQNTTLGNEGCDTAYGCECAGTVAYVTMDGVEWSDEMFESIPDSFWCVLPCSLWIQCRQGAAAVAAASAVATTPGFRFSSF